MMRIRCFLIVLLFAVARPAYAVQAGEAPGLLPTQIARPLLEQDPGVAAARAGLDVALQQAGILDKSPYEWVGRVSGQQRRIDSGPNYNEWNLGIERTIRLPGKAKADQKIGNATIEEAEARYGEAVHEAARQLMSLWVEWLASENAHLLAELNLSSIQSNLAVVEKRVRAGDASKLDLSIAHAELAEQKRMANDAKTQASAAWLRLSTRFPGVNRQVVALPVPLAIVEDSTFWHDRILTESDELKIVQTQMETAQGRAERAEADKLPDPTLGLYTASEVGGRERISGIMLSVPIPGDLRSARSAKAKAEVEVSRREIEIRKRQLEAEIASNLATARGAYESLKIANEGAAAMQDNASLMQRAYALGEADLQSLLLARRQATAAANSALQVQTAALKGYYGLLVDAHLVWDLQHNIE